MSLELKKDNSFVRKMARELELKRCPFCGGKGFDANYNNLYWIYCLSCYATTDKLYTREAAVEAWNRRVSDEITN